MKKDIVGLSLVAGVIAMMALSIWGPEAFSKYRDKSVLNEIHVQEADDGGEGYRYALSRGEKTYILAEALNSRILPESEQYAVIRGDDGADSGYPETAGSYASVSYTHLDVYKRQGIYKLTPVGEFYAEYARKVLELTAALERDIKRVSTTIRINIGNSASRSLEMLTSLLTDFRKRSPKVELTMTDCNVYTMSSAIARDEVDVAFVTAPSRSQDKGRYMEVKKEEVLFAASSSHPYCKTLDRCV